MARNCGCAGASCGCLVRGVQGITVTGIGTQDDPYMVSADLSQLNQVIAFQNSSTITFAVTGTGSLTDPMSVSATAIARPFPPYTTGGRPSAIAAGVGAFYYDTTLSMPEWSDGAVWKPAVPQSNIFIPKVGQYLLPMSNRANTTSTNAYQIGVVPGSAIQVTQQITIDQLHAQVSTLEAATSAMLLIYKSDADGHPATLVASGSVDASSIGFKTVTIAPVVLPPGIYWCYIRSNSAAGTARFTAITQSLPVGIAASAAGPFASMVMNAEVGTYAAPLAVPTSVVPAAGTSSCFVSMRRSA